MQYCGTRAFFLLEAEQNVVGEGETVSRLFRPDRSREEGARDLSATAMIDSRRTVITFFGLFSV